MNKDAHTTMRIPYQISPLSILSVAICFIVPAAAASAPALLGIRAANTGLATLFRLV